MTKSYTPTRFYPKYHKGPSHPEARWVPTKNTTANLLHENAVRSLPAHRGTARRVPVIFMGMFLTKHLGSGSYGAVFEAVATAQMLDALRRFKDLEYSVVTGEVPPEGATVVVKFAKGTVEDNLRETLAHLALTARPCQALMTMDVAGVDDPPCAADFAPPLYCAGWTRGLNAGQWAWVTVMARAPGDKLEDHIPRHGVSLDLYLTIERAVCSMWLAGLVHGDLHRGNMMYDRATGRLTLIDFGFAVRMSPDMLSSVRVRVAEAVVSGVRSLGEVWRDAGRSPVGTGLQAYVNRVMSGRLHGENSGENQTKWYNPDGNALLVLYGELSARDRAAVPRRRRELWGAAPPAPVAPLRFKVRVTRPAAGRAAMKRPLMLPANAGNRGNNRTGNNRVGNNRAGNNRAGNNRAGNNRAGNAKKAKPAGATNTGQKDAKGRTVYKGPRGGLYVLSALGNKIKPAGKAKPAGR
jgi:hypothetical protein